MFDRATVGWVLATAALCVAATAAARRDARHTAVPGYLCSVGRAFEDDVWLTRTLDDSGRQVDAHMDWRAGGWTIGKPRLTALWSVSGSTPIDVGDGATFISWTPLDEIRARRRRLLALELTNQVKNSPWPASAFSAAGTRDGATILARWSEITAFARGSSDLVAVLRDRKGKIVDQTPLPPAVLARADGIITAALTKMAEVAADYRTRCRHVDDVEPDVVVS